MVNDGIETIPERSLSLRVPELSESPSLTKTYNQPLHPSGRRETAQPLYDCSAAGGALKWAPLCGLLIPGSSLPYTKRERLGSPVARLEEHGCIGDYTHGPRRASVC